MLERIVAQVTVALIGWLDRRMERGTVATDADADREALRRAGDRLRDWLRHKPDGVCAGGVADEDRSRQQDQGVPPGQR